MKKLNINEIHSILLNIAKEFDSICRKNKIPYVMLGGTMLGAIRHKGFIPWDDDMDFGVPRNYYEKLKVLLETELPQPYKCSTFDNSPYVIYPFLKIEDRTTRLDAAQLKGDILDKIGINIDIFPLDLCCQNDAQIIKIIRLNDCYGRIYTQASSKSFMKNMIKTMARIILPVSQQSFYNYIQKRIQKIQPGDYFVNLFGHWELKEVIPQEWVGKRMEFPFSGISLWGLVEYDLYLTQLYGDYMVPPSENRRVPHGDSAYKI